MWKNKYILPFSSVFLPRKANCAYDVNQTYWREKQRSEYNADGDRVRPQITHTYMRRGKNKSYLSVFYLFLGIESVNLGSYCLFYFGSMFISSLETLLLANKY